MQRAVSKPLPYAVEAALVECAGKVFWYWESYRHFLRKSGVNASTVARLTGGELSKYEVMRRLLPELDNAGAGGRKVQAELVRGIASLPLSQNDGIDVAVAESARTQLRVAASEAGLLEPSESQRRDAAEMSAAQARRAQADRRRQERERAERRRKDLFSEYCGLLQDASDKQGRGYRLEEMFGEVAELDGLRYAPPYRKGTVSQTDGMVSFEGFQYLIEARWRMEPADVAALGALASKAGRSLQSTRALFLSVVGFREEVVREMETGTKNLLLMTGHEFSLVLGGSLSLGEALQRKVDEGAKKGHIFFDLVADAAA